MSFNCVIFDLDDTIVDSSMLLDMRDRRKWKECVSNIGKTEVYKGVLECVECFLSRNIKVGIVTSSVSFYAEKILKYHRIQYNSLICYHDAPKKKPNPDPVLKCMENLNANPEFTIGFGDSAIDAQAYIASGISSCGVMWSKKFEDSLQWNYRILEPQQALDLVLD